MVAIQHGESFNSVQNLPIYIQQANPASLPTGARSAKGRDRSMWGSCGTMLRKVAASSSKRRIAGDDGQYGRCGKSSVDREW
jgi:hypothetical protein